MTAEKNATADADFVVKYSDKTAKAREAAHSLATIDAITKKYQDRGEDVPGFGVGDTNTPGVVTGAERKIGEWFDDPKMTERARDADTVSLARSNLVNSLLRKDTGAAAAQWEVLAERARAGAGRLATAEQQQDAIEAARDAIHGDLRAYGSGRPAVARRVLKEAGIDPDAVGFAPDVPTPAAANAPVRTETTRVAASPDGTDDDGERYDVRLTSPKGKTITASLSKPEVEGYASNGWKVEGAGDSGPDIQPLKVGKQSKLAPAEPGELGPPVGLDVEVAKPAAEDRLGKWDKKGKISRPKPSLTDDDLYERFKGVLER